MVKVVGIDEKQIKRATCRNCASILEYTQSETVWKNASDYSGDSWRYRAITCPKCSEIVSV